MSEHVQLALIAGVPPTLLALAAFIQALRNYWETKRLRRDVDGRLTQLLAATTGQARAEGQVQGMQQMPEVVKRLSGVMPPTAPPPPPRNAD